MVSEHPETARGRRRIGGPLMASVVVMATDPVSPSFLLRPRFSSARSIQLSLVVPRPHGASNRLAWPPSAQPILPCFTSSSSTITSNASCPPPGARLRRSRTSCLPRSPLVPRFPC